MEPLFEMMRAWDPETQAWFLIGAITIVGALAVFFNCYVWHTVQIIIRGYPSDKKAEQQIAAEDSTNCEHEDNLTGKCLKSKPGCLTKSECDEAIERHNEDS